MYRIGLDYHTARSVLCILDGDGKIVKREQVPGGQGQLLDALGKVAAELGPFEVCFEATCGYGRLYEGLRAVAARVVVAHPGKLKLIYHTKRKNDRVDAEKLAKMLYAGLVPEVHVPGVDTRAWRMLIEHRCKSVAKRTAVKNAIRAILRTFGLDVPEGLSLWTRKGLKWLGQQTLPTEADALRRDLLAEELNETNRKIVRAEKALRRLADSHPGVAVLMTAPGVGIRTAEAVVAYVDDPQRFRKVRCVGSYFGLVPCQDASADKNRLGHITREGPSSVRQLLCEATWQGMMRSRHLKHYFERVMRQDPERKKIALIATAHHLLRCLLAMLRTGQAWQEAAAA